MYIPEYFKNSNRDEVLKFIASNSFGLLVSNQDCNPIATHIPFELMKNKSGEDILVCHIAKANPQWKEFELNQNVLVIFSGPNAYISSSWYNHENVPTWNYIAVHVYGKITFTDNVQTAFGLSQMVSRYESKSENPISFETMSAQFKDREIRGLIGFEISMDRIEANFKLSQNRDQADFDNIIKKLQETGDHNSGLIAEEMIKLKPIDTQHKLNTECRFEPTKFVIAEDPKTKHLIFESRLQVWGENGSKLDYMLDQEGIGKTGWDKFDDCSDLACLIDQQSNRIIGSCRATPWINGEFEISSSLPDDLLIDLPLDQTIQVNRLVFDHGFRNIELYLKLFGDFAEWLLENRSYIYYFAICNSASVRLYERVGANKLYSNSFNLKGRGTHPYYLIYGTIQELKNNVDTLLTIKNNKS